MFAKARSLRRLVALLSCISVLLVALPMTASMQQPQGPRSYEEFIRRAYLGAYGRQPTCIELQNEYNNLVDAAANGQLNARARRFVATLFMTNASYDMPPNVYVQTNAYNARNPADSGRHRDFVTDLYRAFLQREPDTSGLDYWTNDAFVSGRRHTIRAFEESIEFNDLVSQLFDGGAPCCLVFCPSGYVFNPDTCSCEPDPYGCGPYGQYCY
ncbi:MAG: hypothetical protein QOD32_321 [Pyrinomonadaceae bacterium]|jgi:hypothetical protein|nr:hypothetical protein [Pyrinomonadaceae bacterium]